MDSSPIMYIINSNLVNSGVGSINDSLGLLLLYIKVIGIIIAVIAAILAYFFGRNLVN